MDKLGIGRTISKLRYRSKKAVILSEARNPLPSARWWQR